MTLISAQSVEARLKIAGPVVRPALTPAPYRNHARSDRFWAEQGELVLRQRGDIRRWEATGLRVQWVTTAGDAADHGVDPLTLDPGGFVNLPALNDAPSTSLRVLDWLSDPDLLGTWNKVDPLAASGLGAVLESAGAALTVVTRREDAPPLPRRRSWRTSYTALLAVAVCGSLTGLTGLLTNGGTRHAFGSVAISLGALAALGLRGQHVVRLFTERRTRWTAQHELRPLAHGRLTRGFLRNARVALVGRELVVCDAVAGELWLGLERDTGVSEAVIVTDEGKPVRLELRRADGISLARLPWDDWFSGDGGSAMRLFMAQAGVNVRTDVFVPDARSRSRVAGQRLFAFSAAATYAAQVRQDSWEHDPFTAPYAAGVQPSIAALTGLLFCQVSVGWRGGAAAVLVASLGPLITQAIHRKLDRQVVSK